MLPKKSVVTHSGITISRKGREKKRKWLAHHDHANLNGYRTFIEALASICGGRMTIMDLAKMLPLKGISLDDCIEENKEIALEVIRGSWIVGYVFNWNNVTEYLKTPRRSTDPIFNRDNIREHILALLNLQEKITQVKHLEVYWCLEEAIGQFRLLLEISKQKP